MALPVYPLTLASAQTDGTALANSTTATNILHGSGIATIPAGALQIGSTIKVLVRGRVSTLVTSPGTLTLDVRFGTTIVVFNGGAMTLNTTAQTNATFEFETLVVIRALGTSTSANALGTGRFVSRAVVGSAAAGAGGAGVLMLPDTAPAVGSGFDSTASQSVNVFATWSVANAANSIQTHQSIIELKV
jgi:hypothetical protein